MVNLKLYFYGVFVLICFLLHVVGILSNSIFIYYSKIMGEKDLVRVGLTFWRSWWRDASTVAVFTCLLSAIFQNLVIVAYFFVIHESHTKNQEYSYSRKLIVLLKLIKWVLLANTLFIIVNSILLTLSATSFSFGFSLWLQVASLCISPVNILIARRFEELVTLTMKQKFTKIHPLLLEIPNDSVGLKSGDPKISDL
ncbi:G_PROTEIN_RECEP_F1_2 domain-containing protein [Caenorhabditis elegans]|uniref:G_PROTEIN_RECEP_F1_2 domain-containing protein n=1 Tax=Caenorhabditis elegans TaxID=6239 RepID=H8W3Z0_CAEEL|nr:G_PROTEIN_RECEP_F1_2 domain-containing protein [Caenorhabditis elegans]CCG28106.1 G_PROTEIN_RECEP_F1_2 domain-containing protein [Caenorhabditis elegans]|eukprot:NP_001254837.1 Uncharacterized protein CELE_Y34F4.6 [Caenorhabditis elegans]